MKPQKTRLGISLMVLTTLIFAAQDAISLSLARDYNIMMVVMTRYWFFAAFVIALAARRSGGIRAAAATKQLPLQIARGLLLAAEILVTVLAFVLLGLVESHAIFALYPLIVAALAGPILGEHVGWRRWVAIAVGFIGMIIIINPSTRVFHPNALVAVAGAGMFALYSILTRLAARKDNATTSFFYTGTVGAVAMTCVGLPFFENLSTGGWVLLGILCLTGAAGHFTLIKCYELAEASTLQPFAYLQIVFASAVGLTLFAEHLPATTLIGCAIIVAAGLFTLWREHRAKPSA